MTAKPVGLPYQCWIHPKKKGLFSGHLAVIASFEVKGTNMLRVTAPALLFCLCLSAQDYRATILGQVADSSQAAIPNVTVRVT